MKRSLRFRYFRWLALLLLSYYAIYIAAVYVFNRFEIHELHHDAAEERMEFVWMAAIGGLVLPFVLALAWLFSKRMHDPLRQIASTAERIGLGQLDERLVVPGDRGEIARLSRTLNEAFDRYQRSVERLREFSSNASHQFRTPLTAMRSIGEIALQKPRTPEEYREIIGSMLEEVQRLSNVVEQLLLLARMEFGGLRRNFTKCRPAAIIRDSLELRSALLEGKSVKLVTSLDEEVETYANADLLRQAIGNLVDNAIRHTPEGGSVSVSVRRSGNEYEVCIADTGAGIPESYRHRMFERFSRGATTTDNQGVGLGLAIVAEVVRLHEGAIEVTSTEGKGARFVLNLPIIENPVAESD